MSGTRIVVTYIHHLLGLPLHRVAHGRLLHQLLLLLLKVHVLVHAWLHLRLLLLHARGHHGLHVVARHAVGSVGDLLLSLIADGG